MAQQPSPKNTTLMVVVTAIGGVLSSVYQLAQLRQQETKSDALVMSVMNAQATQIEALQKEISVLREACQPGVQVESMMRLMAVKPEKDGDGLPDSISVDEPIITQTARAAPLPVAEQRLDFEKLRQNAAQGKVWKNGEFVAY